MKAQPLAYDRDNQEDKEPLLDAIDTVRACVKVYAALVPAISVKRDAMREAARRGLATATDLADYLVEKGAPFRDAVQRHPIRSVRPFSICDCKACHLPS